MISERLNNTKVVIRSHISKDRQYNGQKRDKMTNNDVQNITQKPKDLETRNHEKPGMYTGAPER